MVMGAVIARNPSAWKCIASASELENNAKIAAV